MRKDWNKVMLGSVVGLGALALFHFGRPAKDRAGVGDKVVIGTTEGGVQITTRIKISSADAEYVTGFPYKTSAGMDFLENFVLTFPRKNIIGWG